MALPNVSLQASPAVSSSGWRWRGRSSPRRGCCCLMNRSPTSDSELRESLCGEMSRLLRQLGITALYVTHDRREAELLADQIVYLSAGRVAAVRAVTPTSGEVA